MTTDRDIDWQGVREALEASRRAMSGDGDEGTSLALRERATDLARVDGDADQAALLPVQNVRAGRLRCAVPVAELAGVVPVANLAPVPGAAAEVLGVFDCHGDLRPLVDLVRLLQVDSADDAAGDGGGYALLLSRLERAIGLRVDELGAEERVDPAGLTTPPEDLGALDYLARGWFGDGVLLLDVDALRRHPLFAGTG